MSDKIVVVEKKPKFFPFSFGSTGFGWHAIESFAARCPKEYQFYKVRGIKKYSPFTRDALSIGLLVHAARAQWLYDDYQNANWHDAMKLYAEGEEEHSKRKLAPGAMDVAIRTFEAYVDYWRLRPRTKVLAVEHELKPRGLTPDSPQWAWRGARLDSIEFHQGKAWIGELKTTTRAASVKEAYMLHGQILLQIALWGAEEVKQFGELGGVLIYPVAKPSGKNPAKGFPFIAMPVSSVQHALTWFRKDFTTWVMQASMIDWNASPERRPSCMRAYGPCEYRELCLRGRDGTNQYVLSDGKPLVKWEPSPGKEVPPWL